MTTIEKILREYGQTNLLEEFSQKRLPETILEELLAIDWEKIGKEIQAIKTPKKNSALFQPCSVIFQPTINHPAGTLKGKKLGCIVMAGGQATRLNGSLPKGLIPVSPVTHKPTLQMIAEKVLAYSNCYNMTCYLAIMTSEAFHKKIEDFFSSHNYFGLRKETISFFKQGSLPVLDESGQLIIKDGSIFQAPDGNGSIFSAFTHSPAYSEWEKAGVTLLSIINSDNPLIDPFLPNMFEPLLHGVEMTAAAVERTNPEESVGLFVYQEKKPVVVEYSEIDASLAQARDSLDNLLYKWANISFFACTLNACKKAARNKLPLHMAKKSLHGISFWKAEYFVFDHCPLMSSFQVVPIERDFFAPIKALQGPSSPEEVGRTLLERDKKRFFEIFKKPMPQNLELPEDPYYRVIL